MVATVLMKDTLVLGLQEWFRRLTTGKMPVARQTCLLSVMMLSLDPESPRGKMKNEKCVRTLVLASPSVSQKMSWAIGPDAYLSHSPTARSNINQMEHDSFTANSGPQEAKQMNT